MKLPVLLLKWLFFLALLGGFKAQAQQVNVTSITPNPVCAGATITATYSYTLPDPGTVDLYLNGPNTTNRLIGSATTNGNNGSVSGTIPADRATGSYTVYIRRTSNILPTPIVSPASSAFTVNALPAAPGVTPLAYCQSSTGIPPLTANGQNLKWYTVSSGGTGSTTAPTPPTSSSGTTNYYVTQTNSGCEGPRATLAVTINPRPAQPTVVSSVSYCQNSTAPSLTSSVTSGSNLKWYATLTGSTGTTVAPTPSTVSTGQTTYYVSQTGGNGCESDRAAITVTIKPGPAAPAVTSPATYCQSQTATPLSATPVSGASLNWFGPANNSLGSTAPTPPTSAPGTTFYSVSQTFSGCTGPVTTISVTVNTRPVAPTTRAVSVCQGTTPVSLATGVTSGSDLRWYTTPTGGTGSTVAPTPSTGSTGTTPYYVSQVNANGCESDRAVVTYTVTPTPEAPTVSSSPLPYCQNATAVPLTATPVPNATLTYYTVATGGIPYSSLTPSTSASDTYYVSQTLNNCEGPRATISVVVNARPPRPAVTTPATNCQFAIAAPLSATAATDNTLSWYGIQATGGTASTVAPAPATTTAGAFTYYVSQKDPNGCESDRAAISVTIYPKPDAPVSTPVSACLNSGSYHLAQSVTATGTLNWYTTSTGGTGSTDAPVLPTAAVGSITYYVSQTNGSGCESDRVSVTFTVNPLPTVALSNDGPLTCTKPGVLLIASSAGSGVLTYRFSPGASQVAGGSTATVTTAGVYSVTAITTDGCTATASTTVTGDLAAPSVSISPSSALLTCASPSVSLSAVGNGSVRWSTGETSSSISVSVAGTYSVTVTGANRCTATAITTIQEDLSPPTEARLSSGTLTCGQTSLTLTASARGGVSYRFSGGTPVGTGQVVVTTAGVYSVTITGANGCSTVAQTTVDADQAAPSVSISPSSATLTCALPSVSLSAVGNGSVRWSTGETSAVISVSVAGTYSVTLTATNGCMAMSSVSIGQDQRVPTVSITANPSLTIAQGQSATLTASATGPAEPFGFRWSTGETTPTISVSVAGPYSVSVTGATGCSATASAVLSLTSGPVVAVPFAITAVTTLNCTPILPNRYSVSFTPRYAGLNGQSIAFGVVNELGATNQPGPYTIQLYTDNPRISLSAVQTGTPGAATYVYDWLAACTASANTPPRLVTAVPPQSATVGVGFSYVIPQGTFTDDQTPGSLLLSAQGLPPGITLAGYTLRGVPSTTVGSPFSVTLTATDPGNLGVSTSFGFTVAPAPDGLPQPSQPFAITGVSMLSCTPIANRVNINFSPRYAGLTGQAIAFRVVNELGVTNEPGPYSLTLYRDNPLITLTAIQAGSSGETTFAYNWLAACASQGQDNTAPRVAQRVDPQSATVGQGYSLNLATVFTDTETPDNLVLSASGLPAGLSLTGTTISGTPSVSGTTTVTLRATDPGSLTAATSFVLTVSPVSSGTTTVPFAITSVTTVRCEVVSEGQRRVSFTPQYAGLSGQPILFAVVNELSGTTNAGPYSLSLYTDNPIITLSAQQGSVTTTYAYAWLAACPSGARTAAPEVGTRLQVRILGNPVDGTEIGVEVRGAQGQPLRLSLTDLTGHPVSEQLVEQAGGVETLRLSVGTQPGGMLLLRVSTPTQSQTVKVLKR